MESTSEVVSNTVGDKPVCTETKSQNTQANENLVEKEVVTESIEEKNTKNVETAPEMKAIEKIEQASEQHKESEEIVDEEEEESDDGENVDTEKGAQQTVKDELVEEINGDQLKSKTVTTVSKLLPDSTTITVTNPNQLKTSEAISETNSTSEELKREKEQENSGVTQGKVTNEQENIKTEEDGSESEEESDDENDEADEEQPVDEESVNEPNESVTALQQQQPKQDQIQQENDTEPEHPITIVKEETVVDAPSAAVAALSNQHEDEITKKQENLNNSIKDIISNIDDNIQAQENIAALKERELELIKKQQELTREIEQQKVLAQKLASENQYQQHLNNNIAKQESSFTTSSYQPINNVSKYSNFEEKQDNNIYTRKSETFETRESTDVSKKIDLHKIFTPATDAEEILPKNRKLYASSAFYSPALHPTVEDQVELARRISHSLSDISNQQSRGQSMYVNRKKRSVKWIHEGSGQDGTENENIPTGEEYDQEVRKNDTSQQKNTPLKFLMNPSGQMRDINSLRDSINTTTGLLSPDVSAEVVNALQAQRGKGAELFAKRRKVAEKWVVDENNVGAQSPSGLSDYHQYQQQPKPATSPSILPAYSDAAKHRVLLNLQQEQLLEKYAKPGLKVVQTPWEAALNSGSASAAFVEEKNLSPYPTAELTPSPTPQVYDASQGGIPIPCSSNVPDSYTKTFASDDYQTYQYSHAVPTQQIQPERQYNAGSNSKRELAYKPSIPQGWRAPSMSLPEDLYMPKEIPLQSYAPPPVANIPAPISAYSASTPYDTNQYNTNNSMKTLTTETAIPAAKSYGGVSTSFPVSKPYQQGFASTYGSTQPPKQQYLPPQSYQKVSQNTSQNVAQVNFNPSPLPYDKLAKFENPPAYEDQYAYSPSTRNSYLNVRGSKVRNTSPSPFAGLDKRAFTPSSDSHHYGGTASVSPRPNSSTQHYSGHNTPILSPPSLTSNQLYNAPSYNTSARGWGCGGATSGSYYQPNYLTASKPQIVNVSSMPYTDF